MTELDAIQAGIYFVNHEQRQLEKLAGVLFDTLSTMTGPRNDEAIAALLEDYANKVREGSI